MWVGIDTRGNLDLPTCTPANSECVCVCMCVCALQPVSCSDQPSCVLVSCFVLCRTMLSIAQQICRKRDCNEEMQCEPDPSTVSDPEAIWIDIQKTVASRMKVAIVKSIPPDASLARKQLSILAALVCYAVSEDCPQRRTHIGRVLSLSRETQHRLMRQIETCRRMVNPKSGDIAQRRAVEMQRKLVESRVVANPDTDRNVTSGAGPEQSKPVSSKATGGLPPTNNHQHQNSNSDNKDGNTIHSDPVMGDAESLPPQIDTDCLDTSNSVEPPPSTPTARRRLEKSFSTAMSTTSTPSRPSSANSARPSRSRYAPPPTPMTVAKEYDNLMDELREQNAELQRALEESRQREVETCETLKDSERKWREELIKVEAAGLRRSEETREDHERQVARFREELHMFRGLQEKEEASRVELGKLRDEVDLLQDAKIRLQDTEERYRKCRERLDQLADVKDALKREETAHNASVSECVRLENELQTLLPLKRQLEEYKDRATDAEVRLAECQEDLRKVRAQSNVLQSAQRKAVVGAKLQLEEANEIRKQLYSSDKDNAGDRYAIPSIGEGVSELNPKVREELERLRNENENLREFASKREDDEVQKLEQRLDDTERLSSRFKGQFLETKRELETTQENLALALKREETLNADLADLQEKHREMSRTAEHLAADLGETKLQLHETEQLLDECEKREDELKEEVLKWTDATSKATDLAAARLEEIKSTQAELESTLASLMDAESREKTLQERLEELTAKLDATRNERDDLQQQFEETKATLENTSENLKQSQASEERLQASLEEETSKLSATQQELANAKIEHEEALRDSEDELEKTKMKLQEDAKNELDQLQWNMNCLLNDERASGVKKLAAAEERLQQVKQSAAEETARLKGEHARDLEETKNDAEARISKAERDLTDGLEAAKKKAQEEKESIVRKGKGMMRDVKLEAKTHIADLEEELQEIQVALATVEEEKETLQKAAKTKFDGYKKKMHLMQAEIKDLRLNMDDLEETNREIDRERSKLVDENDKFRRQLGGRYGADGKAQSQLEMLQKEFNAILEENRELKKRLSSRAALGMTFDGTDEDQENHNNSSRYGDEAGGMSSYGLSQSYSHTGVGESTVSAIREEYEEQLGALKDEKRELVMRNSAAATQVQKAEQQTWEMEKAMAAIKDELTSTKLDLQRAQMQVEELEEAIDRGDDDEDNQGLSSEGSFPVFGGPVGTNDRGSQLLLPIDEVDADGDERENVAYDEPQHDRPENFRAHDEAVLSPTSRHNKQKRQEETGSGGILPMKKARGPDGTMPESVDDKSLLRRHGATEHSEPEKTLMDLTKPSTNGNELDGSNQECNQS